MVFSCGVSCFEFLSVLSPHLCASRRILFTNFLRQEPSGSLYFKAISKSKACKGNSLINRKNPTVGEVAEAKGCLWQN